MHVAAAQIAADRSLRVRVMNVEMQGIVDEVADEKTSQRRQGDCGTNGEPQTFAVNPPRTAKDLTLQIADWISLPDKQHDGKDLIGIDNIYLKAQRPPDFAERVRPMLNIGGMVEYPRGAGGIVPTLSLSRERKPEERHPHAVLVAVLPRDRKSFST